MCTPPAALPRQETAYGRHIVAAIQAQRDGRLEEAQALQGKARRALAKHNRVSKFNLLAKARGIRKPTGALKARKNRD